MPKLTIRRGFCLALALAAPIAGSAQAGYIYEVSRSVPCDTGCTGDITVTGFVEVDKLGILSISDFIDWKLSLVSTHETHVLTPSSSNLNFSSLSPEATLSALSIAFVNDTPRSFAFSSTAGFPSSIGWGLATNISGVTETVSNMSNVPADQDHALENHGTGTYTLLLPMQGGSVPVPGTALLVAGGLMGVGGYRRRRP